MRRRTTFVYDPSLDIDPKQLYVSGNDFVVNKLKAAREEKLTLSIPQLPGELQDVLNRSYELHLRWATEAASALTPPFVSRISPGLHVYYTPLLDKDTAFSDLLCPLLHKLFSPDLKCRMPLLTFSKPSLLSEQFSTTPALHYHSVLRSPENLTRYIQQTVCEPSDLACIHSTSLLNAADSIDIDYTSISNALSLTVHWSRPPPALYDPVSGEIIENAWSLTISPPTGDGKVEVGVVSNEPPNDPHEYSLSGFLTVVGEDQTPKASMFSFPSRHHLLSESQSSFQAYQVSFPPPTGLHPTLKISFPSLPTEPTTKPPQSTCALHAYLTLPSVLFADKYQLSTSDPLFLSSHNLAALRSISGELDLEAPEYTVDRWGSNLLLELAPPISPLASTTTAPPSPTSWNVTVPLHLRYLPPSPGGYLPVRIPWPVLFWACTAEEGARFPISPFDRVHVGYEALFGQRTMFYHLHPDPGVGKGLVEDLRVPVLDTDGFGGRAGLVVEWGTVGVVVAGFLWVVWKLWVGRMRSVVKVGDAGKEVALKKKQ